MTTNNKVQLTGFLGDDPKSIIKGEKKFLSLRVATTDSYLVKENDEAKWQNKETVWHNVLIFRQAIMNMVNSLKKGDKIELTGSISYKPFKNDEGYTKQEAIIIGEDVKKLDRKKVETIVKETSKKFTRH